LDAVELDDVVRPLVVLLPDDPAVGVEFRDPAVPGRFRPFGPVRPDDEEPVRGPDGVVEDVVVEEFVAPCLLAWPAVGLAPEHVAVLVESERPPVEVVVVGVCAADPDVPALGVFRDGVEPVLAPVPERIRPVDVAVGLQERDQPAIEPTRLADADVSRPRTGLDGVDDVVGVGLDPEGLAPVDVAVLVDSDGERVGSGVVAGGVPRDDVAVAVRQDVVRDGRRLLGVGFLPENVAVRVDSDETGRAVGRLGDVVGDRLFARQEVPVAVDGRGDRVARRVARPLVGPAPVGRRLCKVRVGV
jgi:hypothetical protein